MFLELTMLWRAFITSRKLCPRYGMVRIGLNLMLFLLPAPSELRWLLECATVDADPSFTDEEIVVIVPTINGTVTVVAL